VYSRDIARPSGDHQEEGTTMTDPTAEQPQEIEVKAPDPNGEGEAPRKDDLFDRAKARIEEALDEAKEELSEIAEEAREEFREIREKAPGWVDDARKKVADFLDRAPPTKE